MDEEELARSLIDAARESIHEEEAAPAAPEAIDESDELDSLIHTEARRVRAEFRTVTDAADRHRLQERYTQLDRWMAALKAIDNMQDQTAAEELKRALREAALETLRKWRREAEARQRQHLDDEAKRRHAEHAGTDAGTRRIRDEIETLLKHYTKANDYKIQSLVDKWRRSGDPSFDPSITARLQTARKRKGNNDYAF